MENEQKKLNKRSFFGELLHPEKKTVLRVRGGIDKQFLILVVLLVCFGSIMIFSAGYVYAEKNFGDSFYFVKRQFIFGLIGIGVMILLSNVDYALFKRFSLPIFIIAPRNPSSDTRRFDPFPTI